MANNDNIIYARFNHGHEITTDPRSQYAYGQVVKISGLHLPASFDADIANKGDKQAKATIGTNNELPIDDNYFLSGKDIIVMINVHATAKDGRTKYIINIPIEKRSKRADIELEPVEQDVVSTAIATLNEAVEQTSANAESAENSANRAHESAMSAEQSATNASNSETLVKQYAERAEIAAESSEKSETNAKASEESAKQSESHAEQIANDIEQFTERAETASRNAESSATTAIEKADEISESAYIATTKANEASNAATYAGEAATYAGEFANSASASANKAELNAQKTQSDKEVVELAKSDVMSAVDSAQNYAESAQSANQAIQDMNVQAVTLDVGSDVTVKKTVDPATGAVTLTYGIPKGVKGDKGDTGEQGIQGEKGDKGDDYVLTEQDKQDIAELVDTSVDDVQINGTSIVQNSVANILIDTTPTQGSTNAVSSGGVYDAIPAIDPTLTQSRQAADAKKTGDEITSLKEDFNELEEVLGVTSAPSKNLNRTPYKTATVKGVAITVNSDNSLTFSGTPTGNIYYPDATLEENRWFLPAGTYTLSGGVDAWKVVNLRLYETKTTSDLAIEYSCGFNDGKAVTFTTTQDYYAVARVIINYQNDDLTGVTLYPQLEAGEEKTAYVSPWSGEKTIERLDIMERQIASAKTCADSAIEDVTEVQVKMAEVEDIADANSDDIDDVKASVGYEKNVISSRNLNKTPYDASYTASGLTVITNEDNTLSLSGDPTANVWWPPTNDPSYRWFLPAGTYTLSGGVDAWKVVNLRLYETKTTSDLAIEYSCGFNDGKAVTFTTEQNYWAYVRIYVNSRNEEMSGKTLKPQVEAGTSKTAYQSPWEEKVEYNTKITDVEQDINTYKQTRPFAKTGNLVQYRPVKDNPVTMRIDFESVNGFTEIRFTHCGRNLLDMQKAIVDGSTKTLNGLTGVKNNGVVHVTGKNTSNGWTKLFDGYMSSNNYWLPAGHYSILKLGLSTKNQDDTSANESNTFVKTMPWQAVQWYASVRGGHTVDVDYPLVILSGDERPTEYIPFVGEHVVVSLPQTVYGGWIDISNSVLHVTKNLSNGALVDAEETTYDLDPITLTEIDEINTLYSIDGVVSASGALVDFSKPDFKMPVPDFYLNDGYLQGKIDRINELAETSLGNGDMFFVITDCHLENNRLYSVPLIRELSKNCNIPRLFNCGDVSDGTYSITKDYIKLVKDNFKGKTHYVFGNHEYMGTPENKMNYWFNLGVDADRHGEFKRNYYYVDNAQSKIRYIILNGYKENTTATNWSTGYEEAQRTWLQNEALNVNDGWGIIVFTHNTFAIDWETGLKSGYDGTMVEAMLNVLDAYDGDGEVIAVFGGHMHVDAVEHTTGGIPVILTTCDKPQPYMSSSGHADFDSSVRTINTISEQAFDVALIDRDNRTINLVRIGCPALNLVDDVTDGYVEERTVAFKQLT